MNQIIDYELIELETPKEFEHVVQRFIIQDVEQLNWAFRKLRAINKKQTEIESLAQAEYDRIKNWEIENTKKLKDSREYFEGLIEEYAQEKRNKDENYKKDSTPYGELIFRKQQPEYVYDDEKTEELIQYLQNQGRDDLLRYKTEINKADIKKAFAQQGDTLVDETTGEIIPHIQVIEREDKLNIKVVE